MQAANLDCGHNPSPHSAFSTGTARTPDGREVCWSCATDEEIEQMRDSGLATLYILTQPPKQRARLGPLDKRDLQEAGKWPYVGNWTGYVKFPLVSWSRGRHNMCGERLDVRLKGPDGHIWHGVHLGDNDLVRCKRTKEKFSRGLAPWQI